MPCPETLLNPSDELLDHAHRVPIACGQLWVSETLIKQGMLPIFPNQDSSDAPDKCLPVSILLLADNEEPPDQETLTDWHSRQHTEGGLIVMQVEPPEDQTDMTAIAIDIFDYAYAQILHDLRQNAPPPSAEERLKDRIVKVHNGLVTTTAIALELGAARFMAQLPGWLVYACILAGIYSPALHRDSPLPKRIYPLIDIAQTTARVLTKEVAAAFGDDLSLPESPA